MFQTNLFRLLNRYSDNTSGNPVADFVLHYSHLLSSDSNAMQEFTFLMDLLINDNIVCSKPKGCLLELKTAYQTIQIMPGNLVYLNNMPLACHIESCCGLASIVAEGEVVAVFPLHYLNS